MWRKSKPEAPETDFKNDIPEYSDEEILEILKKQKYYQSEAVEVASEEAVKRELINSEQDIFHEDFRTESLQFGLFPNIEDEKNKNRIRKSIARGILISGVLPTVFGFLKLNDGNNLEGILLLAGGILWILFAAKLIQRLTFRMINGLVVLSVLSFIYIGRLFILQKSIVFMDAFIVGILYSLLFYGLFFLRKLK